MSRSTLDYSVSSDLEENTFVEITDCNQVADKHKIHKQSSVYRVIKRTFDILFSFMLLILLLPILLMISFVIAIFDRNGAVIYSHDRIGLHGVLFKMYKFRSMREGVNLEDVVSEEGLENYYKEYKLQNDPRVTRIGGFLRKTSLDELPQLVNIIKGDMSIVGPRPPIPSEVEEYEPWHRMRLSVTPGLTCIWQVSGRSNISFEGQMRLDNDYIKRNGKLSDDVSLILKTFKVVFKGEGAY